MGMDRPVALGAMALVGAVVQAEAQQLQV